MMTIAGKYTKFSCATDDFGKKFDKEIDYDSLLSVSGTPGISPLPFVFIIWNQYPIILFHPSPDGYTGKTGHVLNLGLG